MSNGVAVRDKNQELIRWMSRVEGQVAFLRSGLGQVRGKPRVQQLIRMQEACKTFLGKLIAVYQAQEQASRAVLMPRYLSTLIAFKLFCDDVYIETLEEGQHPRDRGSAPLGSLQVIEDLYQSTIEDWIVGSPLIDSTTAKGLLPRVHNYIDTPQVRGWDSYMAGFIGQSLSDAVRGSVKQDITRIIAGSTKDVRLSPSSEHLLGVVYLLAQLELKLRWEKDQTRRSHVDSWYQAAARPVKVIAEEVLGVFDGLQRDALLGGRDDEADRLLTARHLTVNTLATCYSLRRQETRLLLSFFEKQNKTGPFASQDVVIGANRVKETLFAYVGRPNPDDQANRAALSVGDLRARAAELAGTDVKAFGRINASATSLTDELTKDRVGLRAAGIGTPPISRLEDRRVIVEGSPIGSERSLAIEATSIVPHSAGYRALVGFPLRFAQTDRNGNLEQLPSWRRLTPALQRAAKRELDEHEEGVFSVSETLAGQAEFVTDLLRHEEVRKAFAAPLKKAKTLDLQDTEVRVKVWSVLFKELVKNGARSAVRILIGYLDRYFALFTRHTYFNLRDGGKPYVKSVWPTDLTNRTLHDCGVYAVQAAHDLFRAVAGTPGLTLEFRFPTVPNHMCLVAFFDNAAFLVNNAKVYPPKDVRPHGKPTGEEKLNAAFEWAARAFTTVYDVSYIMPLAFVPQLSVDTNRSVANFERALWKTFLGSHGWGVTNDAAIAEEYFKTIEVFDTKSTALDAWLSGLRAGKPATEDDWDAAARLSLELYALGEAMSEFRNFGFERKFVKGKPIPAVGFFALDDPRADGRKTLPMYEMADLLSQRKKKGQRLTTTQASLEGKLRRFDHVKALTDRFIRDSQH